MLRRRRVWDFLEDDTTVHAGDIARRINAERLVVLGWGRAILLQLAHPLVAAGVADHSTFRAGPTTRYVRLHSTIQAMLALTFGTAEARRAATDHINAIHDRVHGTLAESAGRFPAGTPYSARDPALLIWVDATLRDSLPLAYERFVGPLTPVEHDRYCAEGEEVMTDLRIPPGSRPRSRAALTEYMASMFADGSIAVSGAARELAHEVVAPPFGRVLWPAGRVNRLATIGLLPPAIREAYGFEWTARDEEALARWAAHIRRARGWCPGPLALWPVARRPSSG
jgi:uncharacterized protein (DUF2236 family)